MSRTEHGAGEFGGEYWEHRYRSGEGAARHDPSPALAGEVGGLDPGAALDAGCGQGADARWLAARGWRVTAVDVSATALERARQAAGSDRLEWVHADLTGWDPGRRFDLVSSQYVHAPGPAEALFARLASWVAPGGTLLVVGHDGGPGHAHAHPAGALVRPEQVTGVLPPAEWDVVVAEPRTHVLPGRDGGRDVVRADVVVRARRTRAAQR